MVPPTASKRVRQARAPKRGGRRIFVGDIQGCCDELEWLLKEVDFRPSKDHLLPVGDLVNRGPRDADTLRLLIKVGAKPVLGNHDLHLLDTAAGRRTLSPGDTIGQVLEAPDRKLLLTWLAAQPILRIHHDHYQVHAGIHPGWQSTKALKNALAFTRGPKKALASTFCTRARHCDKTGELPSKRVKRNSNGDPLNQARWQPWYAFFDEANHAGRHVVYGHWAQMGYTERETTLGLDSGCVWGGSLTAYIQEEEALVSVPAARAYAGNFRPR